MIFCNCLERRDKVIGSELARNLKNSDLVIFRGVIKLELIKWPAQVVREFCERVFYYCVFKPELMRFVFLPVASYCGVAHQKADWKANHKRACVP